MQKEFYTKPESEISCFKVVDLIATSSIGEPDTETDDNFVDNPFA